MTQPSPNSEAARLESIWSGEFGDEYTQRNASVVQHRKDFWHDLLEKYPARRVLEVGCNLGGNLKWISQKNEPQETYGIDINQTALNEVHKTLPGVNALKAVARNLPFRDRWFDMTFTMGVLIHQPESTLPLVMSEIVRCSNEYIFCGEYASKETQEVSYRGHEGALFRRDYGGLYQELFPELKPVADGFLSKEQGWDDVTWWLFKRS